MRAPPPVPALNACAAPAPPASTWSAWSHPRSVPSGYASSVVRRSIARTRAGPISSPRCPTTPRNGRPGKAAGEPFVEAVRSGVDGPIDYVVSHAGERAFGRSFQLLSEGGVLTFFGASSGYRFSFMGKPGERDSRTSCWRGPACRQAVTAGHLRSGCRRRHCRSRCDRGHRGRLRHAVPGLQCSQTRCRSASSSPRWVSAPSWPAWSASKRFSVGWARTSIRPGPFAADARSFPPSRPHSRKRFAASPTARSNPSARRSGHCCATPWTDAACPT